MGSTLKSFELYNFLNAVTSPFIPVISSCNTFIKSHWSAKLDLTLLAPLLNLPILSSDLPVLSGCFLECFFKFFVGKSLFFASFKLVNLLPNLPPTYGTKNPKPVAVNAIVPVLTGSILSLNSISFSTS